MKLTIQATNFDATEKLQLFAEKKVNKLTKLTDKSDAELFLKVVKPETAMNKEAELKIGSLFASKTANTFEEAIDLCVAALEKQLGKSKKRGVSKFLSKLFGR